MLNDFLSEPNPKGLVIKALALDLDGTTLRPDASLSARTLGALKACLDRGIQVILCTGRSPEAAEVYRSAIGTEGPMVYFNGAEVVDMPGGTVLEAFLLPAAAARHCVQLSRETGVYLHMFFPGPQGEILLSERLTEETEFYRRRTGLLPAVADLEEVLGHSNVTGCIKAMFIGEGEKLEAVQARLEKELPGEISQARSSSTFLEVMLHGVSKGRGLLSAMDKRSLKAEELIAFGDEENDLPMFAVSGYAVAPANARQTVREAANAVIGSNDEDGVAAYLEGLFKR
jgi:Cof subfamily protein (haloacid dehalogenase superfamily)